MILYQSLSFHNRTGFYRGRRDRGRIGSFEIWIGMEMGMEFQDTIEREQVCPAEVASRTHSIYEDALRRSHALDAGNFTSISPTDLARLFDLYDERFFAGGCRQALGTAPLSFRLSKRMTQAAGKATRVQHRDRRTKEVRTEYEIAVSTTLLFQTFHDVDRPIVMSGIECRDRLESLQRILEHELVHLIEFILWQQSSCSAARFQSVANRFFSHTEHTHQLITPRERAFAKFGVKQRFGCCLRDTRFESRSDSPTLRLRRSIHTFVGVLLRGFAQPQRPWVGSRSSMRQSIRQGCGSEWNSLMQIP